MEKYEINTPLRAAHFLAQVGHESGRLVFTSEIASGKAYNGRKDLGNTDPEASRIAAENNTTPGEFYKGHGLIQVTGYANHKECGEALNLDLVNNPTLLTMPEHAAMSAGWFWESRALNELADFDLIEDVTRKVNGRPMLGLANRKLILYTTLGVLS
jgi:putative chitinase